METKGERREAKRIKKKHAPIRNKPPGEARTVKVNARVFVNGKEFK